MNSQEFRASSLSDLKAKIKAVKLLFGDDCEYSLAPYGEFETRSGKAVFLNGLHAVTSVDRYTIDVAHPEGRRIRKVKFLEYVQTPSCVYIRLDG